MQAVTASSISKAGYIALSEAVEEVLYFRQVQDFIELSMRILHVSCRAGPSTLQWETFVRHDLVRDACEAGKVRLVCVRTDDQQQADWFTKPLDIQKFCNHTKTDFNVV